MKKQFSRLLLFAAVAAAFSSCSDESPWAGSDSQGGINLQFSTDSRVMRQSRADQGNYSCPDAPAVEQFAVRMTNSDGSYTKDWSGVEAFNREKSFPIGDYSLSVYYGDADTEGFGKPCFKGASNVHVSPNSESTVSVVATLANSMVSVRYTDAFKENFTKYSASVQTSGHSEVVFAQDEERPAYVSPSDDVKLNLTLTDTENRQVTIQPASFNAVPRHHYIVTFDVNGSTGDLFLDVIFAEEVEFESVEVSLGDELFTAPAPVVKLNGDTRDVSVSGFESLVELPSAEFQVFAFGGLKETNLNFVTDSSFVPSFGKSAQLVNAAPSLQSQLEDQGVKCSGFFNRPDKMGVVNVTDFLKKLPAGAHSIELKAVDAMTRVSEPVVLNVNIQKVKFEFGDLQKAVFGATQISFELNTNCPLSKDKFTFFAPDAYNRMVQIDPSAVSVSEVTPGKGSLGYTYRYVLTVDPQTGSKVDVRAEYNGESVSAEIPVIVPEYTLEADAFAKHVVFRVTSENDDAVDIMKQLTFVNNGSVIGAGNISYDYENRLITIVGLTPGSTYDRMSSRLGRVEKAIDTFVTEEDKALTNGGFDNVSETVNTGQIQVGGDYRITFLMFTSTYQNMSSVVRSTPVGWADLNELTCWSGSSNKNTWFMVPSTYAENGAVVVRSVGYHHDGVNPAVNNSTATYYNSNAPADLNVSVGELFLGSYSFDGSAHRSEGIDWTSRPSSVTFNYSYEPENNEQGEMSVSLLDASGSVILTKTVLLDAAASMTPVTVDLAGYPFGKSASSIKLGFKSTRSGVTPSVHIPQGAELDDGVDSGSWIAANRKPVFGPNQYKAYAKGSVLTVDNVVLGYDLNKAASQARKKSSKRR